MAYRIHGIGIRKLVLSLIAFLTVLFTHGFTFEETRSSGYDLEVIKPVAANEILFSPGTGIYFPTWCNEPDPKAWYKRVSNIAYTRFTWAQLEPEEGRYRFDKVLGRWINRWRKLGYRVAFGVMSTSVGRQGTPKWVFQKGVPGVTHHARTQIDPIYWHPLYLDIYSAFVMALGQFLSGGQQIEFVDMRGIGVWGEMHLGKWIKGMWTDEELKQYGYTYDNYFNAYKEMINVYLEAFPNTNLFLNISRYDEIAEYAAKKGIGLRYDGLGDNNSSLNRISSNFSKFGRNGVSLTTGVKCNYEFARRESDLGIIQNCLKKALSDPISYLNINLGPLNKLSGEAKDAIRNAALRIGYRFTLKNIKADKILQILRSQNTELTVEHDWMNEGVAPCYRNYNISFMLVDRNNSAVAISEVIPDPPTINWAPSIRIKLRNAVNIPAAIKDGKYMLKVFMYDPSDPRLKIKLGIAGKDDQDRYDLASIRIETKANNTKYLYLAGLQKKQLNPSTCPTEVQSGKLVGF